MSIEFELAISKLLRKRDDIFFKLPYARSLLVSEDSRLNKSLYLNHIYAFNNFFEYSPRKNGAKDFLYSFKSLAKAISSQSFLDENSKLPIDAKGNLRNGSHRLSLKIACSQLFPLMPISLVFDEDPSPQVINWDFNYFSSLGMNRQNIDRAVMERISFFRNLHSPTLLIYPRAEKSFQEIIDKLNENGQKINSITKIVVDENLLSKIIAVGYSEDDWATNEDSIMLKCKEAGGSGLVYMISLQESENTVLSDLKSEIRKLWNHDYQGIHITDDWWQSFSLYSTLSNPNSLEFLYSVSLSDVVKSVQKLSKISRNLNEQFASPYDFAISGSQILEFLGIREAGDLDLIVSKRYESEAVTSENLLCDLDNEYFRGFGLNPFEIVDSDRDCIWLFGMRFVKLEILYKIWCVRKANKDVLFLSNVMKHLASQKRVILPAAHSLGKGLDRIFLEKVVSEKYLLTEILNQRDELTQQRDELTQQRDELLNSTIWKITKPWRVLIDVFKKPLKRRD